MNIFSHSRYVLFGGGGSHVRLELSCIQVNVVIFINTKCLGSLNKCDLFLDNL